MFLSHHQLFREDGTLLGIVKPTAGKQFGGGLALAASTASLVAFDVGSADTRDAKKRNARAAVKSERMVLAGGGYRKRTFLSFSELSVRDLYTRLRQKQ